MASSVHASLCRLQWGYATFRFALGKVTEEHSLLSPGLVDSILFSNESMELIFTASDATGWMRDTLRVATEKVSLTNSTSDRSVDRGSYRQR